MTKLPKGFASRPITNANLELLKKHRDNDDELCTSSKVWKDLIKDEDETYPETMEFVLTWIEAGP